MSLSKKHPAIFFCPSVPTVTALTMAIDSSFVSDPRGELDNLPQTFTLDDIVAMKCTASPTDTDEQLTTKAKTLSRTWKPRQRIIPTEQEGVWEKVES